MSSETRPAGLGLGVVLFLLAALLCTEVYLYGRNTLVENGHWLSSKACMGVTPLGSMHFMLTRNALQRNHLNLGEWQAYNEVSWDTSVEPSSIEARFSLRPQAYVCAIFDRDESGFLGFRVSRNPDFESMLFRADRQGKFLEKWPVDLDPPGGGWHDLRLVFGSDGVSASVDGRFVGTMPVATTKGGFLGFRSGLHDAVVDDVRVVDSSGRLALLETFRNKHSYWKVLATNALILLAMLLIAGLYSLLFHRSQPARTRILGLIVLLLIVCVMMTQYFAFDYFYWSSRYPYSMGGRGKAGDSIPVMYENLRQQFFGTGFDKTTGWSSVSRLGIGAPGLLSTVTAWNPREKLDRGAATVYSTDARRRVRLVRRLDLPAEAPGPPGTTRILFVGTSQTYGSGAEVPEDTFVHRLHESLASSVPAGENLETYNLAIPGSTSTEILDRYRSDWIQLSPDIVVIDLANNDKDPDALGENLRQFLELNRKAGIETLAVLEPNCREQSDSRLLRNHAAMRASAEQLGVPVFDLHAYLNREEIYDSGFLWWDFVHLTSYGQGIVAGALESEVRPLLESALARRS